jgi:prephenate dehydrogenase
MTAEVLLLGLSETGASIGQALARSGADIHRTGYDPAADTARSAHKAGAVDRLTSDPRRQAGLADIVFYNLPLSTLGPALQDVASDLKPDSVLIDTTPLKRSVLEAVPPRLPAGAAFVGAVPILGPERVFQSGALETSADLFRGGLLALVVPPNTPTAAVDICTDLAGLLGARPFFLEAGELDAAMAASEALPSLLAAAYLRSLSASPAWRDHGQLAARTFDTLTRLAASRPAPDLAEDLSANRANVLRWMDVLLDELSAMRDLIARADSADLRRPFEEAATAYLAWKADRTRGPSPAGVSPPQIDRGGTLARLFGLRRRRVSR